MTDFTASTPIIQPQVSLRSLHSIRLLRRLGGSLGSFGKGITALLAAYARAIELAYVAPFSPRSNAPGKVADEDLDGRDPRW